MLTSNWFTRQRNRKAILAGATLAVLLALGAGAVGAAEVEFFDPTTGDNYRVDICYEWGMKCAGEAANMWCVAKGFDRALEWKVDQDIGATHPTIIISSGGQICDEAHCDGYSSITCTREDAWTQSTGNGGLLVQVSRNNWQSPEGILIVAVSEQDPSQATAGVADLNSLALLHTPPGKWRLFALNFNNPQPIKPQPGQTIEVAPGKKGGYLDLMLD